jgi:hypothetical protein
MSKTEYKRTALFLNVEERLLVETSSRRKDKCKKNPK